MKTGRATGAGLLEREFEFGRLATSIDAAVAGHGSAVALEGEAGIGKTSLLAHATSVARDAGMKVVSARGGELEREFAYGVVRQLFEAPLATAEQEDRERWLAGAADLAAPVVSASEITHGSAMNSSAVLHGLYWLSAHLAAQQPMLIAVDDAHWADTASIGFLSYLTRRVDELAVLIIYASRLGEGASDELPAVLEPGLVDIVLRPGALSEAATAELVALRLDKPGSEQFARACRWATSGNPFLLNELLRALHADCIAPEDANTRRMEQIAPRTIARATLARLRRLGVASHELAAAVAVLGDTADLRHAAALAVLDQSAAAEAADALTAAAILRTTRPLEFIHPIVRTTVYSELPPGRRAARHKQAARLLAHDGADDVALAPHLLATEPAGDAWVVERLRAAAQQVRDRGAPAAACTYLERALREPPLPVDRLAVLAALGSAELELARPTALAHLRSVLEGAQDPGTRLQAGRELMWALTYTDQMEESIAIGAQVLASVPDDDKELRLQFEGDLAAAAVFAPASAKAALDRLARYDGKLRGDTLGERLVLACLAFRSAHCGESATSTAELAQLALSNDRLLREHRRTPAPFFLAVWALIYADLLDDAERHLDRAIDQARELGIAASFGSASGTRCQVLIRQGRLVDAEAEALSVLATLEPHAIARAMLLSSVMHTMIERSTAPTTETFLSKNDLDGDLADTAMGSMLLFARGHLRLANGAPGVALKDFEQLRRRNERSGHDTPALPTRASAALAHDRLGEHDRAADLAQEELARARVWGTQNALSFALRTAGIVAGGDAGIDLFRAALAAAEGSHARYERAHSLTEYGAALRRAGYRREAREPLREALDLADRCGALRMAVRAREELLATGARPRRSARSGADSLTPSERRVCRLAADGLSNRDIAHALFVTLRTVEGHLTQSYMKLDISSREALAAALNGAGDRSLNGLGAQDAAGEQLLVARSDQSMPDRRVAKRGGQRSRGDQAHRGGGAGAQAWQPSPVPPIPAGPAW
jgi:DNA-binding CsgD family transcriptional regulator